MSKMKMLCDLHSEHSEDDLSCDISCDSDALIISSAADLVPEQFADCTFISDRGQFANKKSLSPTGLRKSMISDGLTSDFSVFRDGSEPKILLRVREDTGRRQSETCDSDFSDFKSYGDDDSTIELLGWQQYMIRKDRESDPEPEKVSKVVVKSTQSKATVMGKIIAQSAQNLFFEMQGLGKQPKKEEETTEVAPSKPLTETIPEVTLSPKVQEPEEPAKLRLSATMVQAKNLRQLRVADHELNTIPWDEHRTPKVELQRSASLQVPTVPKKRVRSKPTLVRSSSLPKLTLRKIKKNLKKKRLGTAVKKAAAKKISRKLKLKALVASKLVVSHLAKKSRKRRKKRRKASLPKFASRTKRVYQSSPPPSPLTRSRTDPGRSGRPIWF